VCAAVRRGLDESWQLAPGDKLERTNAAPARAARGI
jgi:hypothetical protein